MNGYERIRKALNGEWPDKRPVMLHNFMMAAEEAGYTMKAFREDPGKAEHSEHSKGNPNTSEQLSVDRGADLHPPDYKAEDQNSDGHAQHLPDQANRSNGSGSDSVQTLVNGTHDGVHVGRGEQAVSETQYDQRDHNEGQGSLAVQESQQSEPQGHKGHAYRSQDPNFDLVGKPTGQG